MRVREIQYQCLLTRWSWEKRWEAESKRPKGRALATEVQSIEKMSEKQRQWGWGAVCDIVRRKNKFESAVESERD